MGSVDRVWLRAFDLAMQRHLAIDHIDAGMNEEDLLRYADLPPREAALQFGEDYDLQRVDVGWSG